MQFSVTLSDTNRSAIKELAAEKGVSEAAIINIAISEYIRCEAAKKLPLSDIMGIFNLINSNQIHTRRE